MKIVITGATGYIGRNLVKQAGEKHEVYAIIRESSNISRIRNKAKECIVYDKNTIYDELKRIQPDIVIHLAGVFYSTHTKENIATLLESNVCFGAIIVDAAVEAGCRKFINTGTYWEHYNKETYNPVNLYAATKKAMEDLMLFYVKAKQCSCITLKIFDSYGPADERGKILNLIKGLEEGSAIEMSPGEQKSFYCYIDDLVEGYICAITQISNMLSGQYKAYVLRGEVPSRLKDVVDIYQRVNKKNIEVLWGKKAYREREIMDPSDIGEILPGWKPKYDLEQGLQMMNRD